MAIEVWGTLFTLGDGEGSLEYQQRVQVWWKILVMSSGKRSKGYWWRQRKSGFRDPRRAPFVAAGPPPVDAIKPSDYHVSPEQPAARLSPMAMAQNRLRLCYGLHRGRQQWLSATSHFAHEQSLARHTGSSFQHISASWPPVPSDSSTIPSQSSANVCPPHLRLYPSPCPRVQKAVSTRFRISRRHLHIYSRPLRRAIPNSSQLSSGVLAPPSQPAGEVEESSSFSFYNGIRSLDVNHCHALSLLRPHSQRDQELGCASLARRGSSHLQGAVSGSCLPSSTHRVYYNQNLYVVTGTRAVLLSCPEGEVALIVWNDGHESVYTTELWPPARARVDAGTIERVPELSVDQRVKHTDEQQETPGEPCELRRLVVPGAVQTAPSTLLDPALVAEPSHRWRIHLRRMLRIFLAELTPTLKFVRLLDLKDLRDAYEHTLTPNDAALVDTQRALHVSTALAINLQMDRVGGDGETNWWLKGYVSPTWPRRVITEVNGRNVTGQRSGIVDEVRKYKMAVKD
ncbi:hypothetical protein D9619_009828 [Psilocybe cf. subviscida]|uniref:Uncharacterized protein n=1 Tax=Psilocybe cf. subviscida TaxID=2480587 RepID=A0A8H5BKY1_9AGAR|nr:hypothetical protein D9619_009828 [Psilocybe cf. subviscida]